MRTLPIATLMIVIGLLPAAAGAQDLPADPQSALTVQLDDSGRLVPRGVTYQWRDNALVVTGYVAKRYRHYGRIGGGVLVELLGADGAVLKRAEGTFTRFSPRRKDADRAYFATHIAPVPAGVARLRVRHAIP